MINCKEISREFFQENGLDEVTENLLLTINVLHNAPNISQLSDHAKKEMAFEHTKLLKFVIQLYQSTSTK